MRGLNSGQRSWDSAARRRELFLRASYGFGFFNSRVDETPLHAVGTGSGNGVFSYGASSTLTTTSAGRANFWVEVIFTSTSILVSIAGPNTINLRVDPLQAVALSFSLNHSANNLGTMRAVPWRRAGLCSGKTLQRHLGITNSMTSS